MPTFELVVHTSDKMLPTILQALEGHATLVRVVQVPSVEEMFPELKPTGPPPPIKPIEAMPTVQLPLLSEKAKRTRRHLGGFRRRDGLTTNGAVLKALNDGPKDLQDVVKVVVECGFSENSAGPALSHTIRDGLVIQTGPRTYALAPNQP